ncbi:MAG: tetratricopeptide repeat protein [Leptospiraceae bacterium]|nr:tetratricopeptide repeat protein [Leptospiraceae bacterium]
MRTTVKIPLYILFLVSLLLGAPGCALFGPARQVSTAVEQEQQITDPVAWQAAQGELRQANQLYRQRQYRPALAAARKSVQSYETFEGWYVQGSALYQLGENSAAIKAYEQAEKLNASDQQLLLTMGTAYTTTGNLNKALEKYERLHELAPEQPVYAFKLGTTYKNLRDYPAAYTALKKAETPNFKYLDQTLLQLGDVCLELKKYDEAKGYFEKARQLNPDLQDAKEGATSTVMAAHLEKGNQAFAAKSYDEARSHYQTAASTAPESAAPWILIGSSYLAERNGAAAGSALQKAIELDAANPRAWSLLASAYQITGQYQQALQTLDKGLEIAPEDAEMYNKKGLVYRARRQAGLAIAAFHQALRHKPDYTQARSNLALVLLDEKRYGDARREFQLAASQDPANSELQQSVQLVDLYMHLDRGDRFFKDRKWPAAEQEYQAARKINAGQPLVYNSLGNLNLARKENKAAEQQFQKALALDDANVAALQGLLRVYALNRNTKASQTTLQRLQQLTKNDISAALALGRIKEDANQFAAAETYYRDLLKTHPDELRIKQRLGYVYYKQGLAYNEKENYKSALQQFKRAQEYNPEIPQLADTLQIVDENIQYASLMPTLKRAEALFGEARYREALPLYERVYKTLKRPQVLVKIANCEIALGQEQKGLQRLQSASTKGKEDVAIEEAIYTHFLNKGRRADAEKGFRQLVVNHPDAWFSWYKLGIIDLEARKYASALENFSKSLLHKADFSVAYIARGVTFYEQGQSKQAQAEFERSLQTEGEEPLARYNLGILFLNDGLLDKAQKLFTVLAQAEPANPDVRYQLSFVYFLKGDLDTAESEIEAGLRAHPSARLYHGLSRIQEKRYLEKRDPAQGQRLREIYQKIIRDYSDTAYARESRAKLMRLAPDSQIAQAWPKIPPVESAVSVLNNSLYYFSGRSLVALDSNTKKVLWTKSFSAKPVSLLADQLVHVLVNRDLYFLDPAQGNELARLQLAEAPIELLGSHTRLGLVFGKNQQHLEVYNQRGEMTGKTSPLQNTRFFFYHDNFYQLLPTARELALSRLQNDAKLSVAKNLQLNFDRLQARPHLAFGPTSEKQTGQIALYIPGSRVFVVNMSDLSIAWQQQLPGTVTALQAGPLGRWYMPQATRIKVMDTQGQMKADLELKIPMASRRALKLIPGHLLYVGNDRQVHQLDLEGKPEWSLPLRLDPRQAAKGQIWSLYY